MADGIALSDLIEFIRQYWCVSPKKNISSETLLEMDLGITGDDGWDLLAAIEQKFGISFVGTDGTYREAFGLATGESLFHEEGFFAVLFEKNIVNLSVGQLFDAVLKAEGKL